MIALRRYLRARREALGRDAWAGAVHPVAVIVAGVVVAVVLIAVSLR